jgi:Cu+-exporting ATPase
MQTVQWKVEGMDCTNCALTIRRYLEKEGMKNVKVNFGTGDVVFDMNGARKEDELANGLKGLGYPVKADDPSHGHQHDERHTGFLHSHLQRFLFCLPFTAVLMLDMIPGVHIHWLMNPWVQLGLTIPVFITGMSFFGKSAWKSLRNGIPNMNVLIAIGAITSFTYSLYGTLTNQAADFMFYETTATIITLVFLGNYLEEASIRSTQKALNELVKSQKVMANMIAFDDDHHEHIFPVENTALKVGDLVLIKSGEQVPMDCKILWGDAHVNEAIITGESSPVHKFAKDKLIGGSILNDGTVKAQVTAVGKDTILSGIINLVKQAQGEKPPVQQLADKISAIFVPVVIGIAVITLVINWIILNDFAHSLMRSIAVLVIACPCAMGLATPAAIAVGLGRGARNGILFRNARSLELFKNIRQAVFDKTGTLTTGNFIIADFKIVSSIVSRESSEKSSDTSHDSRLTTHDEFKRIVYSLEKYSNHPIAKCIVDEWNNKEEVRWTKIEEVKGLGMLAKDNEGNDWRAGSFKTAAAFTKDDTHNVYITKNNTLIGWIDVRDEVRPEAKAVIDYLHTKGIKTILLSGDRLAKTKALGEQLGIDTVIAEQTPEQKLTTITQLTAASPTVMIGDGINDAPALAKATVGISMSDASQIAMQTAQVVLMNNGLKNLPTALGLGKHTYITIKQNLFWAFAYNIIAIPIAALGFLTPNFSALAMGLSDVVLAINSVRLFVKKVV